jgi:hypothetical protein
MLEGFAVALLFASIIGSMLALVLPRVPHVGNGGFMFPLAWIVRIATMVVIAVAGSFTAILILSAIGYLKGAGIIATWMSGSLKASIVITLTFGIFVTVLESMRGRLNETTVALRPWKGTRPKRVGWPPKRNWRRSSRACNRISCSIR